MDCQNIQKVYSKKVKGTIRTSNSHSVLTRIRANIKLDAQIPKFLPTPQGAAVKYLIYVFYLEAAISTLSGFQAFFTPAAFLKQFTTDPAPTLAVEMTRWYGVLLFVLVYLLIQGLRIRGMTFKVILQGLLIGDFFQIAATFVTARALGSWSFVLYMSVILSIIYAILRGICLWKPIETGIDR